jgi:hypothetical protein
MRIGLSRPAWKQRHWRRPQPPWRHPGDPREFGRWLGALRSGGLTTNEREEIYWAIHDYFEV